MVTNKKLALFATAGLLAQVLFVGLGAPAFGTADDHGPSGALFTTDENGTRVNQNQYDDKRDVYIDGGPGPNAPQTAAGWEDGNYYFQVTGTDGKALFSSDPVKCREFRVQDGKIVEYVSANRTYPVTGGARFCHLDGKQNGRHDTGVDQDHNALTIQLMPFNNSSNAGGVYKVWITAVEHFEGNASLVDNPSGPGVEHGFRHSASKTDNFKVKATANPSFVTPTLTVKKFDDWDGDGTWDSGEAEIGVDSKINGGGWPVAVVDPAAAVSTGFTPYVYYTGYAGNYTTVEGSSDAWVQTALIVDGTAKSVNATAKVAVAYQSGETHTVVYGNFKKFVVSGSKVNDANGNGRVDSGESTIANWSIQLYRNGNLYATTTTNSNGQYSFTVAQGGNFTVKEVQKAGWTQTGNKDYTFTGRSGQDRTGLVFTNIQNSSQTSPSCILLCIHLTLPTSVSLSVSTTAAADVGTSVCPLLDLAVDVQADVEADAAAGSNNCGCGDTSTTLSLDLDVDAGLETDVGGGSCTNACGGDTSSGGSCDTSCGGDVGADVGVDVGVDVGADVGAGGSGGSCTSACGGSTDTTGGIDVSVGADVGADVGAGTSGGSCTSACGGSTDTSGGADVEVGADAGVDVGAGTGGSSCASPCGGSTEADVGADVSADVGVDVGGSADSSSGSCTSACDSGGSADAGVDANVDVGVDADITDCVDVGASVGASVGADVGAGLGI